MKVGNYIRQAAGMSWHYTFTCKMGDLKKDPEAVLDARLWVRGVRGLCVADANVIPQVTSSNTQAPSVMIRTKCREMLLQDLKRADDEGPRGLGAEPSDLRARLLLPLLSFRTVISPAFLSDILRTHSGLQVERSTTRAQ